MIIVDYHLAWSYIGTIGSRMVRDPEHGTTIMEIDRTYEHKSAGTIGQVKLTVPSEGWVLDGKALSEQSVRHLAYFALQTLQDAYAGADTMPDAERVGRFNKKYDRLMLGTIGTREGGSRNPILSRALQIAKKNAPKGTEGKAITAWARRAVERNGAYLNVAKRQLEMEAEIEGVSIDELEIADESDEA